MQNLKRISEEELQRSAKGLTQTQSRILEKYRKAPLEDRRSLKALIEKLPLGERLMNEIRKLDQ